MFVGDVANLTGLETVLLSDNSKITELEIEIGMTYGDPPMMGLTHAFQALGHHLQHTLTKLLLRRVRLGRDEARLLLKVLYSTPSLQTLVLIGSTLGNAELAELARALYRDTPIKLLNISYNWLDQGIHRYGLR
jgi:hypothetical protein